jgi:thiol-disulfide isomerase/thioredoxin
MRILLLLPLLVSAAIGAAQPKPEISDQEQEELSMALAEAGSSPVEFLRAVEKHMARYPKSPRKEELERAALRAAIEAKDEKRIVLFGERVLQRDASDTQILERVARALLISSEKEPSERALKLARQLASAVAEMRRGSKPEWREEIDRAEARAFVFQARANTNLGRPEEALPLALRAYEIYPSGESVREIGRCLDKAGRPEEAAVRYAEAFAIPDPRNSDADRAKDRARMGELYRKAKGSEAGLGELLLAAYDRTAALLEARRLLYRTVNPNAGATGALDFTISGVDGGRLELASLKGKVVVFDFWATWCGPCRAQHPLYDQVKDRFKSNPDVVFLSINTDEDRANVKPFLVEAKWKNQVWFEDGMSRALQVSSIPMTLVVDRSGQVFSRMNGFVPHRFVDMLSERIRDALAN